MVLHAFYVVEANVRKDIRQNKSFTLILQIEIEKIFGGEVSYYSSIELACTTGE